MVRLLQTEQVEKHQLELDSGGLWGAEKHSEEDEVARLRWTRTSQVSSTTQTHSGGKHQRTKVSWESKWKREKKGTWPWALTVRVPTTSEPPPVKTEGLKINLNFEPTEPLLQFNKLF